MNNPQLGRGGSDVKTATKRASLGMFKGFNGREGIGKTDLACAIAGFVGLG